MSKLVIPLVVLNVALLLSTAWLYKNYKSQQQSESHDAVIVTAKLVDEDSLPAQALNLKDLAIKERQKRMSARYFVHAPGVRNPLTDMIDGMVLEGMRYNVPIARSYEKLLEDEELEKSEKRKLVRKFREIAGEHLKQVYRIQREMDKGDIVALQSELKSKLASEVGLTDDKLFRLIEIEKQAKTKRQLRSFEQILIRDQDKLSETQRQQLSAVFDADQITMFDPPMNENDAYDRGDRLFESTKSILNEQQVEHFRYFQEYHWHSYDINHNNDISVF